MHHMGHIPTVLVNIQHICGVLQRWHCPLMLAVQSPCGRVSHLGPSASTGRRPYRLARRRGLRGLEHRKPSSSPMCTQNSARVLHNTFGAARPKEAPNPRGSHNTFGAARPKEAPNPRVLHNTFGAARPKEAPNPRGLHNTFGAARTKEAPNP